MHESFTVILRAKASRGRRGFQKERLGEVGENRLGALQYSQRVIMLPQQITVCSFHLLSGTAMRYFWARSEKVRASTIKGMNRKNVEHVFPYQ